MDSIQIGSLILGITIVYFFTVFVMIRTIVPNLGFKSFTLPANIPKPINDAIIDLENKSQNQTEYLKNAYELVTKRWHAGRMNTILKAPLGFRTSLEEIWNSPGYAHCNTQNYMLFVLLAGSHYFKAEDIKQHCIFFNFFIHQYLEITISGKTINVDPAGASIRGMSLGQRLKYFG